MTNNIQLHWNRNVFFHIIFFQCSLIADPNDYYQSSFYVAAYQFEIIIHIVKRVAFYPNMKRLLVVTMKLRYEREFDSCVAVVVDFNRWWIVPSQVESRLVCDFIFSHMCETVIHCANSYTATDALILLLLFFCCWILFWNSLWCAQDKFVASSSNLNYYMWMTHQ